ncbi:MAG: hypothetical protein HYV06_06260 [Deltaproteobacteria bacterium]|nr:hypothetical protein [Deltaproteobacteria bacterium]
MKRKWIALILSALVLPGLGQLYLGRKVKGIAIIMAVNLILLLALFVVLKGLSPVIAARVAGGAVTVTSEEVMAALKGVSAFGKGVLAAFVALWVYSLADLFGQDEKP